jgi:hypothetical protein
MNPYQFPVVCSVCGEEGVAKDCVWGNYQHKDPSYCSDVLRRKAKQLEKREMEIKRREQEESYY